jgi:hypothetical protein
MNWLADHWHLFPERQADLQSPKIKLISRILIWSKEVDYRENTSLDPTRIKETSLSFFLKKKKKNPHKTVLDQKRQCIVITSTSKDKKNY